MKRRAKALVLEMIAASFLGGGALLLVVTYASWINPRAFPPDDSGVLVRWHLRDKVPRTVEPWFTHYLVGTPTSLFLLGAAWYFNVRGCELRRRFETEGNKEAEER